VAIAEVARRGSGERASCERASSKRERCASAARAKGARERRARAARASGAREEMAASSRNRASIQRSWARNPGAEGQALQNNAARRELTPFSSRTV